MYFDGFRGNTVSLAHWVTLKKYLSHYALHAITTTYISHFISKIFDMQHMSILP